MSIYSGYIEKLVKDREQGIITKRNFDAQERLMFQRVLELKYRGFLTKEEYEYEEKEMLAALSKGKKSETASADETVSVQSEKECNSGCLADFIKIAIIASLLLRFVAIKSCNDFINRIKHPTKDVNTINLTLKTRTFLAQQSQKECE